MTPIRITTPRAILDWYRRPKKRAAHAFGAADESGDGDRRPAPLPGVTGATAHRLTFEIDDHTGPFLIDLCNQALADDTLHEAKRNAIEATLRQVQPAYDEWKAGHAA